MALFRNLECRHLVCDEIRTSIAMEPEFWSAADRLAEAKGMSWLEWTQARLMGKPVGHGRASWLRVSILQGAEQARHT